MRLEGNWVWKWGDTRGSQIHLVMGQALGVIALDLGFGAEIQVPSLWVSNQALCNG